MSAAAELKQNTLALQHEYDKLNRLFEAKHEELDLILSDIRRETARLEKIRAEIARIKAHFGVQTP
jgi:hypothetical protein